MVSVYEELFAGQEVSEVSEAVADRQASEGKGDGIVPGGHGRTTIFIDTSTVSDLWFIVGFPSLEKEGEIDPEILVRGDGNFVKGLECDLLADRGCLGVIRS